METQSEKMVLKHLLNKQNNKRGSDVYLTNANTNETATFSEVLEMTNKVGNSLKLLNCKKGDTIATMISNRFEAVYSWYGCSSIGAIEVPINNAYKGTMLSHILNDSKAKTLIIEAKFLNRIENIGEKLKCLETIIVIAEDGFSHDPNLIQFEIIDWDKLLLNSSSYSLLEEIEYKDVMHILYTSGTTGPSKGVISTYAQVYETAMATINTSEKKGGDCIYNPYPIAHISSRSHLYIALIYGDKIVIRDKFSVSSFWKDINTHQCTTTLLLDSMAKLLLQKPLDKNDSQNSMRYVTLAPLFPEVREFKKRFNLKVRTLFNMSEICTPITSDGFDLPNYKTCGKIRNGFEARIVNEFDEEVTCGEVGELIMRADKPWVFMQGYWNNPQKTVEAWRNQWLHTEDLFYQDEDGNFYYVDRKSDALRRRGENISSFEIEVEVNSHSKVQEAAAVGIPSEIEGEEIKIFVVKHDDTVLNEDELYSYLEGNLPHFMVPRYIEIVSELPKTETHKVKKALLKLEGINENTWDRNQQV